MISTSKGAHKFILFIAFALTAQCLGNDDDKFIKLYPDAVKIFQSPNVRSTLGIVGGVKSCGGPAEVLEWRYEACNGSAQCQIPADAAKRRGENTIVPSETIPGGLGVRFIISGKGFAERLYEMRIPDSAVKGGQPYTIITAGSPKPAFQGKTVNFKFIIFRQVDNFVESCSETVFEFV